MKAFDWKRLRSLATSRVYKLTALFPIIGYFILFYPGFVEMFSHHNSPTFTFPFISSKFRLYILYYGLFLIGLSSILIMKIPQMFLVYATADEFADARMSDSKSRKQNFFIECEMLSKSITDKDYIEQGEKIIFSEEIAALKNETNQNFRQLYITYYNIHAFLRPRLRLAVTILFLLDCCYFLLCRSIRYSLSESDLLVISATDLHRRIQQIAYSQHSRVHSHNAIAEGSPHSLGRHLQ